MAVSRLMQPLPTLQGRRVVLSPLRDEDADVLFRWISDRAVHAVRAAEDVAAFGIREPRGIIVMARHRG
jgi:hypothetical protein